MTNRQIKKHKKELCTIIREINIPENEPLDERLKKLYKVIDKLQNLADVVDACKYYGTALRDINEILNVVKGKNFNAYAIDQLKQRCAACEDIYKEIYRNIDYTLQREMMFNACVSAKRSCFYAALAAIFAFISIVLTWYLSLKAGEI
jgi:hypothetical protein